MKKSALPVLLLTAIVVLTMAVALIGCTCTIGTGAGPTTVTTVSSTTEAVTTTAVASSSSEVAASTGTTASPPTTSKPEPTSADSTETTKETTATTKKPTPTITGVTTTKLTLGYVLHRFEETDSDLKWAGAWTFTGGADDSGGSLRYAEDAGSAVTAKFTGTSISIITRKGLALGRLTVTLDSGNPITVDTYSANPAYKQKVWSSGTLPAGTHYLRIECAGTKNPASGGPGIYVDALDITGTLQ
jgi:hyaluronate lyase